MCVCVCVCVCGGGGGGGGPFVIIFFTSLLSENYRTSLPFVCYLPLYVVLLFLLLLIKKSGGGRFVVLFTVLIQGNL